MFQDLSLVRFLCFVAVFCGLASSNNVCHSEQTSPLGQLNFSGFGTLGISRSSDDTVEYVRNLNQPHGVTTDWSGKLDSVLGLQADLALTPTTDLVVQILTRYRHDGSFSPDVAWAYLSHDFTPNLRVRVGRMGTEFYLLGDSRWIGYSNLLIRPPPDFFGSLVFNYFDGIDAVASFQAGSSIVRAKAFFGRSPETTSFVPPLSWSLRGSRVMGGYLDVIHGPLQFRLTHAEAKFANEIPLNGVINDEMARFGLPPIDTLSLIPELRMKGTTTKYDSVALLFDKGPLQVLAMYGTIQHESASYQDTRTGFVQAGLRFGTITPYIAYSSVKSEKSELSTQLPFPYDGFPALVSAFTTPHVSNDRHTSTVGVRWDAKRNLAVKLQYDDLRGQKNNNALFRGEGGNGNWDGSTQVFSLAMDFIF